MNLSAATIVLRERTVLEVTDLALRFVRQLSPVVFAKLSVLFLGPAFAVCLALRYVLAWEWNSVWLVAYGFCIVLQGPFTVASGHLLFQQRVTARDVCRDFARRMLPYLGALALRALLFGVLAITLVGPLVVLVQWAYVHEAVLLEQAGPVGGLRRARRVMVGRSGACIEMLLVLGLVFLSGSVFAELLGRALLGFVFDTNLELETLATSGGSPLALLGLLAAVPLASAIRFLTYINERTLRDGWDVQVRFMALREELQRDRA